MLAGRGAGTARPRHHHLVHRQRAAETGRTGDAARGIGRKPFRAALRRDERFLQRRAGRREPADPGRAGAAGEAEGRRPQARGLHQQARGTGPADARPARARETTSTWSSAATRWRRRSPHPAPLHLAFDALGRARGSTSATARSTPRWRWPPRCASRSTPRATASRPIEGLPHDYRFDHFDELGPIIDAIAERADRGMTLKALIFDVDGTLAETEEAHRAAFNRAFAARGSAGTGRWTTTASC